jgi:hypothetical protein
MQTVARSPRISHISWGRLEVEGHPPFKDAKVFPGGARAWDWHETGTHHVPGIQPADVEELIERGVEVVVLSKGYWERLQVCPRTLDLLVEQNIAVEVLQTEAAVERSMNCVNGYRLAACSTRPVEGAAISSHKASCLVGYQ